MNRSFFWGFVTRLLTSLLVLFGVSILIFIIARVVPGNPARIALGPAASPEQIAALEAQLHLNEPLLTQYLYFIGGLLRGDLGVSLYTMRPVMQDILEFLPATLELVLVSGILMIGLGIPLGALAARFRGSWFDSFIRVFSMMIVSVPSFVRAVLLVLVLGYIFPIFPVFGRISEIYTVPTVTGFLLIDTLLIGNVAAFGSAVWHMVLPALAMSLSAIGQSARLTRGNMVETYERPYIEMAQAYGVPEGRIASRYALKPSLIPSLTVIGLDFADKIGGAFIIETAFGWPGISRYGAVAILHKDLNAIVGVVLVIATVFLVVNIIVDLVIALINPAIRYSGRSA